MAKDAMIKLRVTEEDKKRFEALAGKLSLSMSELILDALEHYEAGGFREHQTPVPNNKELVKEQEGPKIAPKIARAIEGATERKHHPRCPCLVCNPKKG